MTALGLEARATGTRQPPFVLFVGLAWLAAAIQLLGFGWSGTAVTLPDADDAMRLIQWKAWMDGQGWYDLHIARLAPPGGYDSHWSRLIDAGLTGLYLAILPFTDAAMAERLTLVLWPMLWLLPVLAGAGAIAWRLGGRGAALLALLLAAFSLPAFQQFRPGRIDHHNVHLAISVLAIAAACWSDRWRPAAAVVGLLTGLALAIGFESLPFVALAGAAFALRFIVDARAGRPLAEYGIAATASTLAAFFVSVGPDRWTLSACDGIALNSAAAVVAGALGLAIASRFPARRIIPAVLAGAAALAVFVALEPRCLGGPYALVDPAIGPIWLDHVSEVASLPRMMEESFNTVLMSVAFPALALLALPFALRRDFGVLVAAAAFLVAFAMIVMAVKASSYAVWFGLPVLAAGAGAIYARCNLGLVPRVFVTILLAPTAVTLVTMWSASALGSEPRLLDTAERQACVSKANIAALAALPRGVILANELEWGPYLLAWSPHDVFAAPYHRLSSTIVAAYDGLAQPPEAARRILAAGRIGYVVACGSRGPLGLEGGALAASLWGRLRDGAVPAWMEKVAMPADQPFTVYRVK